MFSSGELVVIFIVAFLVFGPKRLPELGRALGKVLREINKAMHDVRDQMDTDYEKTEKETSNEAAKPPVEGKIIEEKPESEDKGKV
ncbi:MAG: twin-arginine translocase TatA/TatE family subunit [Thermodesulfovibrionales bacterium]|jgi:TatA/E family protein of Tat protein translocase